MATSIPTVPLASKEVIPRLGLGTWRMGEQASRRAAESAALQLGVELGATLIDTAEMYGEGRAEEIIGQTLSGERDRLFIVSKVYPHNASRKGTIEACERSLRRLKTDRIDLYLLHWRGAIPIAETVESFEKLRTSGKIRYWGVSNFDTADMDQLQGTAQGSRCAANQVLYNLARRGVEWSLLPWQRAHGIPVMAYSPIDQGRLLRNKGLAAVASRHRVTPAQVALAWLLRQPDVITIPKASDLEHVRENIGAVDVTLDEQDLSALDRAFPPPRGDSALQVL